LKRKEFGDEEGLSIGTVMTTISGQQEDDDYEEGKVFGHESLLLEQNDNEFLQIKTNFVGLKWRRK